MIRMNISVLALSVLALSACGSGSANLSSEFTTLVDEAERLTTRLDTLDPTPVLVGPGADYDGVIVIADSFDTSESGVIGQVGLNANFATGNITGSANNFYQAGIAPATGGTIVGSGTPVAGSLDLDAAGATTVFFMDVNGSVTLDGTSRPISGVLFGGYFGVNAEMISAANTDVPAGVGFDVDVALVAD